MLTSSDIQTLIEALSSWEKESSNLALTDSLVSIMLEGASKNLGLSQEALFEESKRKTDRIMEKAKSEGMLRRESSILLQAKLIQMRNDINNELINEAKA